MDQKRWWLLFVIFSIVIFEKRSEAFGKLGSCTPDFRTRIQNLFSRNCNNPGILQTFCQRLKEIFQKRNNDNFSYPIPVFMPVFVSQPETTPKRVVACQKRKLQNKLTPPPPPPPRPPPPLPPQVSYNFYQISFL